MLVNISGSKNIFMTILYLLFKGLNRECVCVCVCVCMSCLFFLATVSFRILSEVTSLLLVFDFSWTRALAQFL